MFHEFDRRAVVRLGLGGAALAGLPAGLRAQMLPARGFTHSVASGDPGATDVLLWTRFVGGGDAAVPLRVEVAEEPAFGRIVARAEGEAGPDHDWCARIRATGLTPGKWYFYRFTGPDGSVSQVGRTRTLPQGKTDRFNIAVFSCSNKPFGYFNAYAHAAKRGDIDLVVHLGDYLYEYPVGTYPSAAETAAGRTLAPANALIALADYRTRYNDYRLDPDLQALHRNFPVISIWDDHEFANDAWKDGAENHKPNEGSWEERKAHAKQAYREWLPVNETPYRRYDIGDLVTMLTLDTRIEGRDHQLDMGAAIKGGKDALMAFHDGPWSDPKRTLMGFPQEKWAATELRSARRATKWQLLAQQIVMARLYTPKQAGEWLAPDASARSRAYVQGGIAAAAVHLPFNMDSWTGYLPARERLLSAAQDVGSDLIVISGDSHNAWGSTLLNKYRPAGVEFAGQSVTSPGFETALVADPKVVAAGLVDASRELKWADTSRRGYMMVAFTEEEARCDWVFMSTIKQPSVATSAGQTAKVSRGRNRIEIV